MKMDWYLMHRQGVGHPCDVDSSGAATCGQTGTGSMFPARQAQIGYATPDVGGFQLNIAVADPAMIDASWNRTPLPRFETEAVYHKNMTGTDELNIWANALTQVLVAPPRSRLRGFRKAFRPTRRSRFGAWGAACGDVSLASGWAHRLGRQRTGNRVGVRQHRGRRRRYLADPLRVLAIANYRAGDFEIAGSYGSSNVKETDWDKGPRSAQSATTRAG